MAINTRQNAIKYEINYVKFTKINVNILFLGSLLKFQISLFQNIYKDFLMDFVEGVRDFRVIGDPLVEVGFFGKFAKAAVQIKWVYIN